MNNNPGNRIIKTIQFIYELAVLLGVPFLLWESISSSIYSASRGCLLSFAVMNQVTVLLFSKLTAALRSEFVMVFGMILYVIAIDFILRKAVGQKPLFWRILFVLIEVTDLVLRIFGIWFCSLLPKPYTQIALAFHTVTLLSVCIVWVFIERAGVQDKGTEHLS